MKKYFVFTLVTLLTACSTNKSDSKPAIKEIVCGDSTEQELFDQNGNSFFTKIPGKCDTIYENAEE